MCFQQIAPNFNLNRLFNKVFDISIELRQAKNVVEKSVQYYVETQQSYRIALLELDDDELSIGAEVTCDDSDSGGGGVSILEELLKAENGNGDALACLQVNDTKIGLALVIGCRRFATIIKRFWI